MPRSKKNQEEADKKVEKRSPKKKDDQSPVIQGPSRSERLDAVLKFVAKEYGDRGVLKPASEYVLNYLVKRLATGILSLDLALGGGFPAGGISQIWGPGSVGKSYLLWQLIRQLQFFLGPKTSVCLGMTEMRADRQQARLAGVQIDIGEEQVDLMQDARRQRSLPLLTLEEVRLLRTQIGNIYEAHGVSIEALYNILLAAVEASAFHLIGIDSFGFILTQAELETDSIGESTREGQRSAGLNTKFLRNLAALLNIDDPHGKSRDTVVVGLNQVRSSSDPYKKYQSAGGKALEHAKFVDLFMEPVGLEKTSQKIFGATGWFDQKVQHGKEVQWTILKGKAGIHEGATGTWIYDTRINSVNFYLDALVAGVNNGIVLVAGSNYYLMDEQDPNVVLLRANGRDNFIQELIRDEKEKTAAGIFEMSALNILRERAYRARNINVYNYWE